MGVCTFTLPPFTLAPFARTLTSTFTLLRLTFTLVLRAPPKEFRTSRRP